jgi:hypothetical protein
LEKFRCLRREDCRINNIFPSQKWSHPLFFYNIDKIIKINIESLIKALVLECEMQVLSTVADAALAVHCFGGNLVNKIFDCRYGIGSIHGKFLAVGGDRLLALALQMSGVGLLGKETEGTRWYANATCELLLFSAGCCLLKSTDLLLKPLSGEIAKQVGEENINVRQPPCAPALSRLFPLRAEVALIA